jgi:hypothetical protein
MRQLVGHDIGSWVFNPSAGTIALVGLPVILGNEQILAVTDTSLGQNTILYLFNNDPWGMTLLNNVLTFPLGALTGASATDALQIYIDIPDPTPASAAAQNDAYTHLLLERIAESVECLATQDGAQRQRVTVDAITGSLTLANVTTVGTVTNPVPVGNVATLGGGNPEWQDIDLARVAANTLRSQLTFGN